MRGEGEGKGPLIYPRCQFHQHFNLAFLDESVFRSLSLLTVWLCNFLAAKADRKMLMKLTTRVNIFNIL